VTKYREGFTFNTDCDDTADTCLHLINMNGYSGSKRAVDFMCQQSNEIRYLIKRKDLLEEQLDD